MVSSTGLQTATNFLLGMDSLRRCSDPTCSTYNSRLDRWDKIVHADVQSRS